MLRTILLATAALAISATAHAATFTVIENNTERTDAATNHMALPDGITNATADISQGGISPGSVLNLNTALNGGDDFDAGDAIWIFGAIAQGDDGYEFSFATNFVLTLAFLSDVEPRNVPIFSLFQKADFPSGTPLEQATFAGGVPKGSPLPLPLSAGSYVLTIDGANGSGGVFEAYDLTLAPVPLPMTGLLLAGGLIGLSTVARRGRA